MARARSAASRSAARRRTEADRGFSASSASAALAYYEAEGRSWERAAYIKARPCAGDLAAGARFLEALRPFGLEDETRAMLIGQGSTPADAEVLAREFESAGAHYTVVSDDPVELTDRPL